MGDLMDLLKADLFNAHQQNPSEPFQNDDFDVDFSGMDASMEDDSLLSFFALDNVASPDSTDSVAQQNQPKPASSQSPVTNPSSTPIADPSLQSIPSEITLSSRPATSSLSRNAPSTSNTSATNAQTRAIPQRNAVYAGPVPAAWVAHQLQLRMKEVAAEQLDLSVCCCSWNVNGKKPTEESLDTWLAPLRARVTPGNNTTGNATQSTTGASAELQKPYDIVAVSFQEIVDLSAKNLIVDPYATGRWEVQIGSVLERVITEYRRQQGERKVSEGPSYVLLCSTHLVGLALCVWVRSELLPLVSKVKTGRVGVGIMGVGGNKGAVGVSMNIGHTSLCFLNAHIAAHQHKVNDRNMHYHAILKRFRFDTVRNLSWSRTENGMLKYIVDKSTVVIPNQWPSFRPLPSLALSAIYGGPPQDNSQRNQASTRNSGIPESQHHPSISSSSTSEADSENPELDTDPEPILPSHAIPDNARLENLTVLDHDHVLWMGDLNYRLAHPDLNRVHRKIIQGDLPFLLQYDQLSVEKRAGRAFAAFRELPITFPPTYKYTPGTHTYEQRPNKKLRMPSWCDRIQWRSLPANSVTPIEYDRAMLLLSDHKPVRLSVAMQAYVQSTQKKRAMLLALKQLNGATVLPKLQLNWAHIHWPEIRYNIPVTYDLIVKNTGNCVVRYIVSVCGVDQNYLPHYHLDHAKNDNNTNNENQNKCELAPLIKPLQQAKQSTATAPINIPTNSKPSLSSNSSTSLAAPVGSVPLGSTPSSFMTTFATQSSLNTLNRPSIALSTTQSIDSTLSTSTLSPPLASPSLSLTSPTPTSPAASNTPAFALSHIDACPDSCAAACSHRSPASPYVCSHSLRPRRSRVGHRTHVDPVTSLWLAASPSSGLLCPGDSISVKITVLVKGLEGHRCNMEQLPLLGRICVRAQDACIRQWTEEVGPVSVPADEQVYVAAQHVGFLEAKDDDDDDEEEEKGKDQQKDDKSKEKSTFGKFLSLFSNKTSETSGSGSQIENVTSAIDLSYHNSSTFQTQAKSQAFNALPNITEDTEDVDTFASNSLSYGTQTTISQNTTTNNGIVATRQYNPDLFWVQQATPIEYSVYVSGNYIPSACGASLAHLCALKGPVRSPESGNNLYVSGLAVTAQSVTQNARNISSAALVPKELYYLIQTALTHPNGGALSCPDFLLANSRKPGQNASISHPVLSPALEPVDPALVLRVRDIMDTCPHLLQVLVHTYNIPLLVLGHAMLDFLNCLCEPLLPPTLVTHLAPDTDLSVWVRALLAELPLHAYASLAYIISLCRVMLDSAHVQHTKVSAQFLTLALTKPLTHSIDTGRPFSETQSKSGMHVVYHLLKSGAEKDITAGSSNK